MRGFVLAVLSITVWCAPAAAEIIDEGAVGSSPVTNRPMRNQVNLNAVQEAFDNSDPRANVERFQYDPDRIYKVRLREYMTTTLILPEGEAVDGMSLGDDENFSAIPQQAEEHDRLDNVIDVYAEYPGADTNLTIVGVSGNVYSFYLRVDDVDSPFMPVFKAYIEDPTFDAEAKGKSASASGPQEASKSERDYLRELPKVDPGEVDLGYSAVGGDRALEPQVIYSDGAWTYFQFDRDNLDGVTRVPAIYKVVDGFDTPVNTRVVGGTLIAESTGSKWTLRSGDSWLCVRRDGGEGGGNGIARSEISGP